jgi:hypothetical protein
MFSNKIEKSIVDVLGQGPLRSSLLVTEVSVKNSVSVQAVYAALKKLHHDEVIAIQNKKYSISSVWIEKISEKLDQIKNVYSNGEYLGGLLFEDLQDGDRVMYKFKNPVLLDQVWGHILFQLVERTTVGVPIMIYNSHYWFPLVREESERTIFTWLEKKGFKAYFSCGSTETLDAYTIKFFLKNMKHSYSLGVNKGFSNNFYMNIVGDYLIEVFLDQNVSDDLDIFFKEKDSCSAEDVKLLQGIVSRSGKNKLVITRNHKKALRYRKSLAREFLM